MTFSPSSTPRSMTPGVVFTSSPACLAKPSSNSTAWPLAAEDHFSHRHRDGRHARADHPARLPRRPRDRQRLGPRVEGPLRSGKDGKPRPFISWRSITPPLRLMPAALSRSLEVENFIAVRTITGGPAAEVLEPEIHRAQQQCVQGSRLARSLTPPACSTQRSVASPESQEHSAR